MKLCCSPAYINEGAYQKKLDVCFIDKSKTYNIELKLQKYEKEMNLKLLVEIYKEIREMKFLILCDYSEEIETEAYKIQILQGEDKLNYFPVFSEVSEFKKFTGGNDINDYLFEIEFTDLKKSLFTDDKVAAIAINPFGMNLVLSKEMLNVLDELVKCI